MKIKKYRPYDTQETSIERVSHNTDNIEYMNEHIENVVDDIIGDKLDLKVDGVNGANKLNGGYFVGQDDGAIIPTDVLLSNNGETDLLSDVIQHLDTTQKAIKKELDIHKLMLGEWVIKEKTQIPSGDERVKFSDYKKYNFTVNVGHNSIVTGATIQSFGNAILLTFSDYNDYVFVKYTIGTGEYIEKTYDGTDVDKRNLYFQIRKAPLDAYVREMLDSKWYKEEYLTGNTPEFKTEMSVYDYYVNNIMEKGEE